MPDEFKPGEVFHGTATPVFPDNTGDTYSIPGPYAPQNTGSPHPDLQAEIEGLKRAVGRLSIEIANDRMGYEARWSDDDGHAWHDSILAEFHTPIKEGITQAILDHHEKWVKDKETN